MYVYFILNLKKKHLKYEKKKFLFFQIKKFATAYNNNNWLLKYVLKYIIKISSWTSV